MMAKTKPAPASDTHDASRRGLFRSATVKRLLRAYGPVLLIAGLFVLMAVVVPTLDRPVP